MHALSEAGLAVRDVAPSDAQFIHQLSRAAFGEYDPRAGRTTANMMLEAGSQTLVAARSGTPIGFVILRRQSSEVLAVNAIAVTPSERGKRVGKRLLQAAEQYAKSHGFGRLSLCTAQANLAALDLFLRAGFVITDRTAIRYFGGQPACKLEKPVS
jgi:ribosomal protein S18 acetylase RimI-like enzyme